MAAIEIALQPASTPKSEPDLLHTVLAEVLEHDSTLTKILTSDSDFDPRKHLYVREADGSLKKYRRIKFRPQATQTVLENMSRQQWCPHCQQHVVGDGHVCEEQTEQFKRRFAGPDKTVTVAPLRNRKSPGRPMQDALIAQDLGCSSERAAGILPVDTSVGHELRRLSERTLRRLQGPVFQDTGLVLLGPEDAS